jgi:hypothetical protein
MRAVFQVDHLGIITNGNPVVNTLFAFKPQMEMAIAGSGYNFARHGWGGACSDYFCTSAGTSFNSFTALSAGNNIGVIYFAGADGTDWSEAASVAVQVDGAVSAGIVPGRFAFRTTAAELLRYTIHSNGDLVPGSAALATGATGGHMFIPTCAGTPTGVPTVHTGRVALQYDTTNNKLYIYNGAWKATVALT